MTDSSLAPVGHLLVQVAKAHRRWVGEALAPHGLHVGQELLLARLCQGDGVRQTELARSLRVELPTVHRTLARMEAEGLVARRADPNDARASLAHLTPAGRAMCDLVGDVWVRAESRLTGLLPREDAALLRDLLTTLVREIEANDGAGHRPDGRFESE